MRLICENCRGTRVEGPNEWACMSCGAPLTPVVEPVEKWVDAICDIPGVGRYARLLPVDHTDLLASSDDALRPVDSPRLARVLGVRSLRLLPQTWNVTGTFKDNEGLLLAAKCRDWEISSVCMHSSGNTARAYQYYMDRAGIECVGFVPQASAYKCPNRSLGRATIEPVPGNMASAADAALAHSKQTGAVRLTPSQWKIEGKVPVGLAIAEHCPDTTVIAVTVASGYGPLGMERAFARARSAGLSAPQGHVYRLFQAADASLLGEAIRNGHQEIDLGRMTPPEVAFEPTLQSTNPNRTLPLIRRLIEETGSRIDAVPADRVAEEAGTFHDACAELGIALEYSTEKSAFICWAGLVMAARSGELRPDDQVTMVVSGSRPYAQLP